MKQKMYVGKSLNEIEKLAVEEGFIQFLNNSVAVKFEDGKIKEFDKTEIEMVDANINVDIDVPRITNYAPDEKVDARQLKQLEDDRNSSTGNV